MVSWLFLERGTSWKEAPPLWDGHPSFSRRLPSSALASSSCRRTQASKKSPSEIAPPKHSPWRRSCQTEGGDDDARKGTQLLEVYAAEIQVQTELRNAKKLKELYQVRKKGQEGAYRGAQGTYDAMKPARCARCQEERELTERRSSRRGVPGLSVY